MWRNDMLCDGLVADWSEVRGWMQLFIVFGTTTLGLLTFFRATQQNRLLNAIKLVERFERRFRGHDYDQYRKLVMDSYEGTGAELGEFVGPLDKKYEFESLFTEGSLDGGASIRTLQELDIICGEWLKKTVSREYIYRNLGQLLDFYDRHLKAKPTMQNVYKQEWKNVFCVMRNREIYESKWSSRSLASSEDSEVVARYDPTGEKDSVLLYDGRNQKRWKI